MRLQHIHISDYKNLKDFTINIASDRFLDVYVAKRYLISAPQCFKIYEPTFGFIRSKCATPVTASQ